MGASLRLKEEATFTHELRWVLEAMKQVAFSEHKRLEQQPTTHEALVEDLRGCFQLLASAGVVSSLVRSSSPVTAAICFTSDAGFIGDLNVRVIREGMAAAGTGPLHVIGEQGRRVCLEQGFAAASYYPHVTNFETLEELRPLWDSLAPRYLDGTIGRVSLAYPKHLSLTRQEVVADPLLPYEGPTLDMAQRHPMRTFVLETPLAVTERALTAWWIRAALARAAWHARLSELAARANHLESAVDELVKQTQVLNLRYFHVLHEEMDKAIREVYASQQIGGAN
ncbi:MAG: F0F1 ATP synthase subunit gamma [Candidatus Omnitrophica bacterium]|nr:F0F1 ATP synthase subunit gamma [Candidatus Omnitrophota bacterium]